MMKMLARVLLAAAPLALAGVPAQSETFVRMVSGPSGGSWYPLGAKIMQVFEENIDGISTSNTSGGGIANVIAVSGGDAEIGWSYAHTTADGFAGKTGFSSPQPDVRHFATLYGSMFQTAVRADSDIQSYADMVDKNISPGKAKWTGTAFAASILNHFGITFDSIKANGGTVHHVDYTESVALMKDGHIDVFMAATNMPQASFLELEHSPGIRFIGLTEEEQQAIIAANPGYIPGTMPKGVYESVTEDVRSLGIVVNLVVNKDLPDDLVYNMCKVFWSNHATFAEVKGVWNDVSQERALDGVAIPVHPGAQRCYDELGVSGS